MPAIPQNNKSLLGVINLALEAEQSDSRRRHLGGSLIGHPCQKKLFFDFRWCKREKHGAQLLRLFSRGHEEEVRFERYLKLAGVDFRPVDPDTKKQFKVVACKGHFGGSLDGDALKVPEALKTNHLVEMKTFNDKWFKKLKKVGMRACKPEHYAQVQVYMHLKELSRCIYMAVNKNDDHMHIERVRYDKEHAYMMLQKADSIIFATELPLGISDTQSRMECGWCPYKGICAGIEIPEKNCRTCLYSAPVEGGNWLCSKYNTNVNPQHKDKEGNWEHEHDRDGCQTYILIPALQLDG